MENSQHRTIDAAQARRALAEASRFDAPGHEDPEGLFVEHLYAGYDAQDQETWQLLVDRQMVWLEKHAATAFLTGLTRLALSRECIPELGALSGRLLAQTGWQSRAVPGYLPPRAFFACMARRMFPTTVAIRPRANFDYLPEPDIFHDVFGHVPLLVDPAYADFLQLYGKVALATEDPAHTLRLARLFWFSVEFGLVAEAGEVKLFGSGLLSSPEEAVHALRSPQVERRPFDLEEVCETSFEIDHLQPVLFVLEDFDELQQAMRTYARALSL